MANTDSTSIPEGYKRCTKGANCKCPDGPIQPETTEFFPPEKRGRNGLSSRCRYCHRVYLAEYRARPENKQRMREYRKTDTYKKYQYAYQRRRYKTAEFKAWRKNWRATSEGGKRESARYNTPEYREYYRQYMESRKDDPELKIRLRMAASKRRARKLNAEGTYTKHDIHILYQSQRGLCWWCEKPVGSNYHIDHRIPLARGGTNRPDNLCISCPQCNQSKNDKMPWEWGERLL